MRVTRRAVATEIARGTRTAPVTGDARVTLRGPVVAEGPRGVFCIAARLDDSALRLRVTDTVERLTCPVVERSGALLVATRVWGRVPTAHGLSRATSLMDDEEAVEVLRDYARAIGRLYRSVAPRAWAVQHTRVSRRALAEGAPWTTGSVNRATATAYHRDSLNLPRAWSGMLVLRGPGVEGGELVLPELDLALDLDDGDVLFFDGGDLWHGNRPLTVPPGSWRYSLPCYGMAGID